MWNGAKFGLRWRKTLAGFVVTANNHASNQPEPKATMRKVVDHFRPRRYFSGDWLNWLNLIYACRRCNQSKDSKWPTIGDADNRRLALIARYEHVSEYICPNQSDTQPLCETLFALTWIPAKLVLLTAWITPTGQGHIEPFWILI